MISSIFLIASKFSILAITGIYGALHSLKNDLISRIHSAFLTKEATIKSTPCSTPNFRSSRSLSVIAGRRIATFGTLTPFFSPSSPPLTTSQLMLLPFLSFYLQLDQTVIDQDCASGFDIFYQTFICNRYDLIVSYDLICCQGKCLACFKLYFLSVF